MHKIKVDHVHTMIEFQLSGMVKLDEMEDFVRKVQEATMELHGGKIKVKADLRGFKPSSPEIADMMRDMQAFGLRSGVTRVAEIVGSDIVALQLNRIARESGADKILRRFQDEESAHDWLIHGDAAPRSR